MGAKLYISIFLTSVLSHSCLSQQKAEQKCATFVLGGGNRVRRAAVVGGKSAIDNEFPHMVAIGYGDLSSPEFLCGGTIISDQYVLTAAHCTNLKSTGPVKMIRAGIRKLTAKLGFQDVTVDTIIVHPKYQSPISYHDVALLKLESKLSFALNVLPACLHTATELKYNILIALGWGKVDFAGPPANNLQKVFLGHTPFAQCSASYKDVSKNRIPDGIRDDIQICAGGKIGKDTCEGDSGGPLEYRNGTTHYIVGVTSFGKACGITSDPGVYTRVSAYVAWIESVVWP